MAYSESTYDKILAKLRATRSKENIVMFLAGILKTLAITGLFLLAASALEALANGEESFRTALASVIALSFVVSFAFFAAPAIGRVFGLSAPSLEDMALRVGEKYPEVKDKLCNVIQIMSRLGVADGTSPELAVAAFDKVSANAANLSYDVVINLNKLKRNAIYFFAVALLSLISFGAFQSAMGGAMYRIANYNKSFLPPPPFELKIQPERLDLLRGEKATIKIIAHGDAPESLELMIKEEAQENFDSFKLKLDDNNEYNYEIPSAKRSLTFYGKADWLGSAVTTKTGSINVYDKPMVRTISGKIAYPSYTKLAAKTFDERSADISGLRGSRVAISALANKNLSKAEVVFEFRNEINPLDTASADSSSAVIDTARVPLQTDGKKAFGDFSITRSGEYYIDIIDADGQTNRDPIKYKILALKDNFPSISMLEPVFDIKLNENALLPIRVSISDDYGFSKMYLHYRLTRSQFTYPQENFSQIEIPLYDAELTAEIPFMWDLKKLNISPADNYEFFVEIFDNDAVGGPKSARTQTMNVRLPSLEEIVRDADRAQQNIERELESALREAKEISDDINELNREMMKNQRKRKLDWREKKKAEDIMKRQEALQNKMRDLQNNLSDMSKQLEENNLLSPETVQKYMELQKLMSEVSAPQLEKMQRQISDALNKVDRDKLQKAMKEAQFDEERFRQSIERTMKILERLKAEQKTDALSKMADDLLEKQEQLNKDLENSDPNDAQKREQLANRQDELKKDLDKMNEAAKELEELMKEIGENMPLEEFEKAMRDLNKDETDKEMKKASEQMKSGSKSQASKSQKKASSNLRKFSESMNACKMQMEESVSKEAVRQMQKAVSNLLELSKEQERLKNQTNLTDHNSTQTPEYAKRQAELFEALANVANSMVALSEKSFAVTPQMGEAISDALKNMRSSVESLADRNMGSAGRSQAQATQSMNDAVGQMQNMLAQMKQQQSGACNNPGGAGAGGSQVPSGQSMSNMLGQLAAQQQAVNQALQQQLSAGGSAATMEQRSEMGRISSEQGGAKKTLDELIRENKEIAGGKKTKGNLQKAAQEMEEVMREIQSGRITPETLEKQERILSRLLDAQRSTHERDFEKKRESKPGKDYNLDSPSEIDMSTQEGREKALRDLLRSIQNGYTKDYEILIQKYFQALQKREGEI